MNEPMVYSLCDRKNIFSHFYSDNITDADLKTLNGKQGYTPVVIKYSLSIQ